MRFGEKIRSANDIGGIERQWLTEQGWNLDGWELVQTEAMTENEADQFGWFTVMPENVIQLEMFYLDETSADGLRRALPVDLR